MKKNIPELLKKFRLEKGLTQKQMADKIFVERTTYTKWENGRSQIPLSKLQDFIQSLKLSDSEVLKLTGNSDNGNPGYLKVLSYYKAVIRFAFDQCFSECLVVAEGEKVPFESLSQEFKDWCSQENGKELTKEEYEGVYAEYMKELIDEDYYKSFEHVLKNNPFCQILFQFGLLGTDYYADFWERFKKENSEPYNFYYDEKELKENFSSVIDEVEAEMKFSYSTNSFMPMTKGIKFNQTE